MTIYLPARTRKSVLQSYREVAQSGELHNLTGRGADTGRTEKVIRALAALANVAPGETVADIGCGDARFLASLSGIARQRFGSAISADEVDLLRRHHPAGIDFAVVDIAASGLTSKYDVMVLAGTLHLLGTDARASAALRNMAASLTPSGRLVISDLPSGARQPKIYQNVLRAWLYVLRARGLGYALAYAGFLARHRNRWGQFVVPLTRRWAADETKMAILAANAGLAIVKSETMFDRTGDKLDAVDGRRNYVLRGINS